MLRLRNELATTARHNLMRSELERTAEVVTQEAGERTFAKTSARVFKQAERLEKELLHVQGQLQQSNGQLAELVHGLKERAPFESRKQSQRTPADFLEFC